jgi:hypothetical protein
MSSTVVWVCRHIQSHVSKSLCLVTLDEVVGRFPYRGRTHRPRKASTKRGNYLRTTFQLGPPPPQVHPSKGVQLSTGITDGLIDSWKPGDFGESRHQISPREVVGRYLEILTSGLGGVVKNVAGEIAEVWQGDYRDMSLAEWRCKDACHRRESWARSCHHGAFRRRAHW